MTTLKEVASRANVSTFTVSCVLNNTRVVSEELRTRVLAAVRETGYRPNRLARSLRCKRTNSIGLIVTNILNPLFTEIARAVEDRAGQLGLSVVLCNSDDSPEKERQYAELLQDKQVDGLIIAPAPGGGSHLRSLIDGGYPIVLVSRANPGLQAATVTVDNEQAAYEATAHLIGHGHSRIGLLLALQGSQLAEDRRRGYEKAIADHGLPVAGKMMVDGHSSFEGGFEAARHLLCLEDRPSAILSLNTMMTLGALRAVRKTGLRCPEEVALAGFSDTFWNGLVDPPVSGIAQPAREMGACAVDLLESLISGGTSAEPRSTVLSCRFVPRRSCGCEWELDSIHRDLVWPGSGPGRKEVWEKTE